MVKSQPETIHPRLAQGCSNVNVVRIMQPVLASALGGSTADMYDDKHATLLLK